MLALSYDPPGRLTQTISASATTQFLYDGDRLAGEYIGGALSNRYVSGPGVDEPLVWYVGSGTTTPRYLHADRQGSVIAYSDASGLVTGGGTSQVYAYGPYGEPNAWGGSRYAYTGQIALPEAQLYHYKARVYDPVAGRFMQTDPIGYKDDLDLYAYVKDDPINHADPSGNAGIWGTIADRLENAGEALGNAGDALAGMPEANVATPELRFGGRMLEGLSDAARGASASREIYTGSQLARNMAAEGRGVVKGVEDAHHIVAQGAKDAQPARDALKSVGIGIHDADNGAAMARGAHQGTHTGNYYQQVNAAIGDAVKGGEQAVRNVLQDFQKVLEKKPNE